MAHTTTLTVPTPTVASRLLGWDHLEWWVGNARAVTAWLTSGFGFEVMAYAGPETGVQDRASYVLAQGDVRFVITAGLGPDSEVTRHVLQHGDGIRHLAWRVDDAYETATLAAAQRGGGRGRPAARHWRRRVGHDRGHRRLRGDPSPLRRALWLARRVGAGLHRRAPATPPRRRPGWVPVDRPRGGQRRRRASGRLGELVPRSTRVRGDAPLRRRPDLHPLFGAALDGAAQRRRHRHAHQRARPRPQEEPDHRVPGGLSRCRGCSTLRWPRRTS